MMEKQQKTVAFEREFKCDCVWRREQDLQGAKRRNSEPCERHGLLPNVVPENSSWHAKRRKTKGSSRCVNCFVLRPQGVANCWRREQDLNLRRLLTSHAFQACALSRSTISPTYFKCNCTLLINNTKNCKNSQMILGTFLFKFATSIIIYKKKSKCNLVHLLLRSLFI